ncbi:MAG TPA: ion channel [Thermoanaerobaculia bacterium]|jgi:inward rectifier potassium channel
MTALDDRRAPAPTAAPEPESDLGFGSVVARESRDRLLNRDGTFNVRREGLRFWESLSAYHYYLTISWPKFLLWVSASYIVINALFAVAYVACGTGALTAFHGEAVQLRFVEAFFFSVHTLATIGYGSVAPANFAANVVVTIESMVGILSFSVIAGIVFARFARPVARIAFSRCAVIAPYRGGRAFMFRIVNQRSSEIVQLEVRVMLTRRRRGAVSTNEREFLMLDLERDRVTFFPLSWTIVHPIDENSPLWSWQSEELADCDAEFLVMLNGFDETFSQTVHVRSSYKAEEVVWGAKFVSMFNPPAENDADISVDIRKLHEIERVSV